MRLALVSVIIAGLICQATSSSAQRRTHRKARTDPRPSPRPGHDHDRGESPPPATRPTSPIIDQARLLPLMRQLARPNLTDRQKAGLARALGATRDPLVVHLLWRLSRDPSTRVKRAALQGLGLVRHTSALPLLFWFVKNGAWPLATAAARALAAYPVPRSRDALHRLALNRARPELLRMEAVAALKRHNTVEARRSLKLIARGGDGVARAAAVAVARPSPPASREPRQTMLLRVLLSAGSVKNRTDALLRLASIGKPDQSLPIILFAADDASPGVRRVALVALGKSKAPAAEARLVRALVSGRTREDRLTAFDILHLRRSRPVRAAMIRLVRKGGQELRAKALTALTIHPEKEATELFRDVFDRPASGAERFQAAGELCRRKDPNIAARLWVLGNEPDNKDASKHLAILKILMPEAFARLRGVTKKAHAVRTRVPSAVPRTGPRTGRAPPPDRVERPPSTDRKGFVPLLVAAGAAGAAGMYSITAGAGGDYAFISGISGAVLGSGTAALLNLRGDVTLSQVGSFFTVAGWSVAAGLQGGLSAGLDRELAWPVLGADILGVLGGIEVMKRKRWDGGDLAFVNLTAAQGSLAGLGLGAILYPYGTGSTSGRVTLGLVSGLMPAAALAAATITTRRVRLSGRDGGLLAYGSVLGGALGGLLVPGIVADPSGVQILGGVGFGQAAGYAGAVVASQFSEVPAASQGWLWLATSSGGVAGGGLGLMVPKLRGRPSFALAAGGAGLGMALGALTHRQLSLRGARDLPLSSLGLGYGAWAGAWFPTMVFPDDQQDGAAAAGGALLGGFTGLLAGNIASRLSTVAGRDVALMSVSTAAGASLGGGLGMMIPRLHRRGTASLMNGVSAAGLVAGAALSRRMRLSGTDVALTGLTAAFAAGSMALVPGLWRPDDDELPSQEVGGGVVAGVGIGTLAGLAAAQLSDLDGRDVVELSAWAGGGFALGGGLGLVIDEGRRAGFWTTEGLAIAGLVAGGALAPRFTYSGRDALLLTELGIGGAIQGAFLPDLWRSDADAATRVGGAMVGSTVGLLAGALIAQFSEVEPGDVAEMSFALAAGDSLGAGLGMVAGLGRSDTVRLMQGVGLAAWVAGGLRAGSTRHTRRDALMMSMLSAGGAFQGAFLPSVWDRDAPASARLGGAMVGASTGLIVGSWIAQRSEMTHGDVGEMSLALAAGNSLGAGVGLLADLSHENTIRLMQGVGTAVWLAGGLGAKRLQHSGRDAMLMAQLSLGGALQGALLPGAWNGDPAGSIRAGGAMVGASLGLIAGSLIAQHSEMPFVDSGEMSLALAAGDALGAGIGMLADLSHENTSRLIQGVGLATWIAGGLGARYLDYSGRDALMMAQLGAGGALQGTLLPSLWDSDPAGAQRVGGLLIGASTGLITGALLSQRSEMTHGDVGEMGLALVAGDALGLGLGLAAKMSASNTVRMMQGVGTAIWIAGGLRAPSTTYSGKDRMFMLLTSGYGAFLGAWAPMWGSASMEDADGLQVAGGLLAGASAGLIAGSLLSPSISFDGNATTELGLVSVGWSLFGAGLGMMIPVDDDRLPIGLMQGVGLAGTAASAFLVDRSEYSRPDRLLTTISVAFGAWQGVGVSMMSAASDRQLAGAVLATAGLGGLGSAVISQHIELSQGEVWTLFSGSVWGATVGVIAANIARDRGDISGGVQVGITTLASDVGLILSAVALSPALGWSAKRIGWINLFGLGGIAVGAAIGGPIQSSMGTQIGSLAGTVAGLTTGIILTHYLGLGSEDAVADAAVAAAPPGLPTGTGAGARDSSEASSNPLGRAFPGLIADWTPAVMVEPDIDQGEGASQNSGMKMLFGVRGLLH